MPSAKDSKGRWWDIVVQAQGSMDCGFACAAMVCRYYKGGNTQTAMDLTKGISKMKPGAGNAGGTGTVQNVAHVLNSQKVKVYNATNVGAANILTKAAVLVTKKTPAIVGLKITTGVGPASQTFKHLSVAINVESDGTVIFLDPYPGVGVVEVAPGGVYTTPAGVAAFDGWLLCTKPH
ncbi:MAG: hypothetical protein JWO04_3371 [Gammaproteobacteria bacterium]|jgi:hypothetical protein|nr:hypothetical protein [Gammaproteobacteria bacterium]